MVDIRGIRSFDFEAVADTRGVDTAAASQQELDELPIDHAASAASNLKEVLRDLKGVLPDKTYARVKYALIDARGVGDAVVSGVRETLLGLVDDTMDAPIYALGAVKDLGDAAVHGLIAGWQKLTD